MTKVWSREYFFSKLYVVMMINEREKTIFLNTYEFPLKITVLWYKLAQYYLYKLY